MANKDSTLDLRDDGKLKEDYIHLEIQEQSSLSRETTPSSTPEPPLVMNRATVLACISLGFCLSTSIQQNICTQAILKQIDDRLGPTTYYGWMMSSYSLAVAASLPISGGLSDVFGRRPFFIIGNFICLIGTIAAAAAPNVACIIAGMTLQGLGAGSQQLALAAIGEIVPKKHRGTAQGCIDLSALPWSLFGALIANLMVQKTALSFRLNFIIGIILNVISLVTIFLWYHPPAPKLPDGKTKMQMFAALDWTGVGLMAFGITLLLLGLTFGGITFPWSSAGVLVPTVLGFFLLVLCGIWESKIARNPFLAHDLFIGKFRTFTIQLGLSFVSGMSMYTAAAFWAQQAQNMYLKDPIQIGYSTMPGGVGGAAGGFLGGFLIAKFRLTRPPLMLFYGATIKLSSDIAMIYITPDTFSLALGLAFLGMFGMAMSIVGILVIVQLACEQKHFGLATLILGSSRALGGGVAVTIYSSILQNTLKKELAPKVMAATMKLGMSQAVAAQFLGLLMTGKSKQAEKLPGVNAEMVSAGIRASQWVFTLAFHRIYYATAAFSGIAVIGSLFVKDVSDKMTNEVSVTLEDHGSKGMQK